jgi:antitoxin MazE
MLYAYCPPTLKFCIQGYSLQNKNLQNNHNVITFCGMKTKIIKIGNSRGIRLPKVILHQVGINDEVDLEVERDRIVLKPVRRRRSGWSEAFRKMAANSDDKLLDGDDAISQSSWDDEEWTWESE